MKYRILAFRYMDSMWPVDIAKTEDAAKRRIDELAREEAAKPRGFFSGDPVSFTYMPIGGD